MRIFCIARNYENWTAFGEWEYLKELANQADVTFYGVGWPDYKPRRDLAEYLKGEDYDLIYYSQCTTENPASFIPGSVARTKPPKIAYMHDGHNYPPSQVNRMRNWDTKLVLYRSATSIMDWYAEQLPCPMLFHPQAVNIDLFTGYDDARTFDVAFPGLVIPHYKFRVAVQKRLHQLRKNGLKVWMTWHPGYFYDLDVRYKKFKKHGFAWREDYAELMNQSKILINSGGKFGACVRKYFEGMASHTLVLGPLPAISELYHFKDGYNIVEASVDDWEELMYYYLGNEDERLRIVENAFETVQKYHTVEHRIGELLGIFTKVLDESCLFTTNSTMTQ